MTEHEISNLQPGQELDRLVAEACGMPSRIASGKCEVGYNYKRGDGTVTSAWRDFRPSTDWNDAMLAAEKAGLFHFTTIQGDQDKLWMRPNTQFQAFLTCDCGYWTVKIYRYFAGYATGILSRAAEQQYVSTIAEDKSGPLAICRAILQAKQ